MLNANSMSQSNAEVSISTAELFGVDERDDPLLAPLEAMGSTLFQHGEVMVASYTLKAGRVLIVMLSAHLWSMKTFSVVNLKSLQLPEPFRLSIL